MRRAQRALFHLAVDLHTESAAGNEASEEEEVEFCEMDSFVRIHARKMRHACEILRQSFPNHPGGDLLRIAHQLSCERSKEARSATWHAVYQDNLSDMASHLEALTAKVVLVADALEDKI